MFIADTFIYFSFIMLIFSGIAFSLSITFLDVGHGDCIVIEGEDVLIVVDAGDVSGGDKLRSYLAEKEKPADILMVTHPHPDHFFGIVKVLDLVETEFIYCNGDIYENDDYYRTVSAVNESGKVLKTLRKGDMFEFENFSLEVIHPDDQFLKQNSDLNDRSLVMILHKGKKKLMLTGDITAEAQKYLLENYSAEYLACDAIKMPHHCSGKAFYDKFIDAVSPRAVIISTGPSVYNYPDDNCIKRINEAVPVVLRTDHEGNISLMW